MFASHLMFGISTLMAASLVYSMWKEQDKFHPTFRDVTRKMRWYMPFEVIPVQVLVISLVGFLGWLVPFTSHGWLYLFAGDAGDTNLNISFGTVAPPWLGIPFLVLVMAYMPSIALAEEKTFRQGSTTWRGVLVQALIFGPVHCVVGVPLAAGVALVVAGLFYGWKFKRAHEAEWASRLPENMTYRNGVLHVRGKADAETLASVSRWTGLQDQMREEALLRSAAYHTVWNWLLVGLLLLAAVL